MAKYHDNEDHIVPLLVQLCPLFHQVLFKAIVVSVLTANDETNVVILGYLDRFAVSSRCLQCFIYSEKSYPLAGLRVRWSQNVEVKSSGGLTFPYLHY